MQAQGWELKEDEKQLLSIARTYKTKNFVKVWAGGVGMLNMLRALFSTCLVLTACPSQALELCQRFGEVAEQEGHHPDLHLQVGLNASPQQRTLTSSPVLASHVCSRSCRAGTSSPWS